MFSPAQKTRRDNQKGGEVLQPTQTSTAPNGLISPWELLQRLVQHSDLNKVAAERLAGWSGAYMQPADRHTPVEPRKAAEQITRVISLVLATLNETRREIIRNTHSLLGRITSELLTAPPSTPH